LNVLEKLLDVYYIFMMLFIFLQIVDYKFIDT